MRKLLFSFYNGELFRIVINYDWDKTEGLTVEDHTLTLRGERKLDSEVAEEQFHRIERSYGSFVRTFGLPSTVDAGQVSAEYKAGVLTVRLPLREEAKPKQIKVKVAA